MRPEENFRPRELKLLSREGIPAALERAQRYRLLNEPGEAESICLDILRVDAGNSEAIVMLILALTDQFAEHGSYVNRARELLVQLKDEYQRCYYSGIVCERQARAYVNRNSPGSRHLAYRYFDEAMEFYDKAEQLRQPGNDEALLRWNSCARAIDADRLEPEPIDDFRPLLE
jgi:hypothetical protein